jgi:hypothetical protein
LIEHGIAVVREVSRPEVLGAFRLAILEAENAPDVACTLDRHGREAKADRGAHPGSSGLRRACGHGSVLVGEGRLVRLLMGLVAVPDEAEARERAELAAKCVFGLYGAAG